MLREQQREKYGFEKAVRRGKTNPAKFNISQNYKYLIAVKKITYKCAVKTNPEKKNKLKLQITGSCPKPTTKKTNHTSLHPKKNKPQRRV